MAYLLMERLIISCDMGIQTWFFVGNSFVHDPCVHVCIHAIDDMEEKRQQVEGGDKACVQFVRSHRSLNV